MNRNQLDIDRNSNLGTIKFPRSQAQADYKISKKKIVRKDGTVFYKKTTTTNDEKISDACIQIFQQSSLSKEFDYNDLREKAEETLFPKFEENDLVVSNSKTKKQNKEVEKKQEIAISQYIRNYIENNLDLTFEVDFDKFVDMTGIKSAQRVGNALKMLEEVQTKASYEYKTPIISEDFKTIEYELTKVSTIPRISLILDEEMGEKYNTISEYAQSDVRNKKKHIRGIKFDINKSYLSSVLGLGRDYTSTNRKDRNKFNSSYSYRLDILLKSIEKVQYIDKYNFFTFEEIQKKFGTQYEEYRSFKRNVLTPAIKDINDYTDLMVELIEHRSSREVDGISFKISRKLANDGKTKFGIDKTAFYIASRLYYFTNQKIDDLLAFAKHIEKSFNNSLDLVMYENKYLQEWRVESEEASKAEIEIVNFMEEHKKLMKERGLYYDEKRMCIVEKYIQVEDEDGNRDPQERIRIITTSDYRVENPMTSLQYLHKVLSKEGDYTTSVIDYIPFSIALSDGWVKIDTAKEYLRHKDTILMFIYEKKLNYFKFESDMLEELFLTNIVRSNFKEISEDFMNMVRKLSSNSSVER